MQPDAMAATVDELRTLMVVTPGWLAQDPNAPRKVTKLQAVLGLRGRPQRSNVDQIVAAIAWAQPTVRGFLANLKCHGNTVEVRERVCQVKSGSTGAKGAYTIYSIATAG
jgi:hypothetical protein